jgi:hypothetical protein
MPQAALLIGLKYPGTPIALESPPLDVAHMTDFLQSRFPGIRIATLLDTQTPVTSRDMVTEIEKLLLDDSVPDKVIYYAGHGLNVPDYNGDEASGQDQAIVPDDYRSGFLVDDTLNALLAKAPSTANVTIILDCCHSGTLFDLPYLCEARGGAVTQSNLLPKAEPVTCRVLVLTACADGESTPENANGGFFTSNFVANSNTSLAFDVLRNLSVQLARQTPTINASFQLDESTPLFL